MTLASRRFCGFCGSEILVDSNRCSSCGAVQPEPVNESDSQPASVESSAIAQRFCGFCGVQISSDTTVCPACGQLQPETPSGPLEEELTLPVVTPPSVQASISTHQETHEVKKPHQPSRPRSIPAPPQQRPAPVEVPKPVARVSATIPQPAMKPRRSTYEPDQILVVRNLSVTKSKKQLVKEVDFSVNRGDIVGILGPSGSGKSTIIKAITGESTGASGQVTMGGFDLHREGQSAKQLFGYVPQDIQLYEDLSFGQNVMYFGGQYGLDKAYLVEKAQKLATIVELGDRLNDKVSRLSGGQKKRVSVATALA